jgi:hypothetical protein
VAHVLKFRRPVSYGSVTLDYIYNVTQPVGPRQPNLRNDVLLVQLLLKEFLKSPGVSAAVEAPEATGALDAATAYWILFQQVSLRHFSPNQVLDGVVSPAKGAAYAPSTFWYIVALNATLKQLQPKRFDALLEDPQFAGCLEKLPLTAA